MAEPAKKNPDGTDRPQATLFDNPPPGPDCGDESPTGRKSTRYDYVVKTINNGGRFYQECEPWLYGNMQVDNLQINGTATAQLFQGEINVQSWKGFDIKHPNKQNYRLRHICLEGPEAGVYFRGRLKNSNIIELPDYWNNLVDPESITVSLTQIGYSQDLIVDKIELGKRILIRSGNGANIDCYYFVQGSRIDGEKLIVEYEGSTPADYPGDSSQFSISGYDYGAKGVDRAD
jgi:hypothetical protein